MSDGQPQHTVTREWLLDMLASLDAGEVEDAKDILRAALKQVEGGDWPERLEG